ncbi:MAG TPA: MBL fold metallo-hydrolase [Verrucomicrobiae bacterium]|jgi:L-ascorbate metabolism protein UlaG (beta-lactamase superfamily)
MKTDGEWRSRFDGQRFLNPTGPAGRGLRHVLRWLTSGQRKRWPQHVPNSFKPSLPVQLSPRDLAATFINHSSFLLQLGRVNLLTDPIFSDRASPVSWAGPRRVRAPGLPFHELPRIDLVLVSHCHYDHMDLPTLRRLRREFDPLFITGLGNRRHLRRQGIHKIVELDWWQAHAHEPRLKITLTPAQHFSSRGPFDRDRALWGGFVVEADGQRVYFAGDSGYAGHFKEIGDQAGPFDLSLLPIGAYEPRWFMQAAHVNPNEAVQAHLDVRSRLSVAMHFGTFQLTDEAIDDPVRELHEALRSRGLSEEKFRVLEFGETLVLQDARS